MPKSPSSNVAVRRSRRLSQQKPFCFRDTDSDDHWEEHSDLLSEPATSPEPQSTSSATSPEPQSPTQNLAAPPVIQYQPLPNQHDRSHSRRRSASHIPRPSNAFILFRSAYWRKHKAELGKTDHRKLSRDVGDVWGSMTQEQKEPFETLAALEKERHRERYPDWKYSPKGTRGASEKYSRSRAAKRKSVAPRGPPMPLERLDEPMETLAPKLEYMQLPISAVKQERIPSPVISLPKTSSSSSDLDFAAEFTRTEDIPPLVLGELQYPGLLPQLRTPGTFDLYGDVNADLSPGSHSQFYDPCAPIPAYHLDAYYSSSSSPSPGPSFGFSDPWLSEGCSSSSSASSSPSSLSTPLHSDIGFSLSLSPKSLVEDILAMPIPDFLGLGMPAPTLHAPVASQAADLAMLEYVNFA